ncbi:MAG: MBL fold metallo-hydrolase [Lachnospiraceae bacterium]|nr:MBL fold metallo-hydrolase [Lachnospiraceae bacterium]
MQLMFIGAAHEVTGSCYYLESSGKRFLVDCGMEQGPNYYENEEIPVAASDLDFVLLTHAHIDHSGLLPLLYARGFRGNIYTTYATADLCDIMLRDSAHIQMFEAEWKNRKGKRAGKEAVEPVYTMEDALGVISNLVGCPYKQILTIADGIQVRFTDAGHLLGSASIEIWLEEDGETRKIVFSGDIGNINQPLIKDPEYLLSADYVVMESTYGNRTHERPTDYTQALAEVIQETFDQGGNVVIPSFAVGRTQEMLYFIRKIKEDRMVTGHENFPVVVDSPLAVEATNIFREHYKECFDQEAMELIEKGVNPITFPSLQLSVTSEESKAINFDERPKVIISASGMCDAGRIKHHLKHNLWRKECTILFVGYQATGTPGRALVEGVPQLKLFGEEIQVNARICVLPGISGHADNVGLMKWASSFVEKPRQFFVCHGETESCETLAGRLEDELHYHAMAPYSGTIYDLKEGIFVRQTDGIRIQQKTKPTKASSVYQRLVAAGQRLLTVIRHNEGGSNKDLAKFTSQINSLCDKWDR